ncbi:MAG: hypothetical protein A2428_07150 [Bdellovibrionales bacterium RIFOXYC1_FULL_54_43]|nr:MAG: hypothetical protein A2428_07150 [Bdellovibrionales bacterium RIFOXYC1_FULL_54_43]OFZ79319.1 MAG: hypothetical protein A2603_08735 [Bdellovibrionales bacterium RIFOXYD1_FULL_55_31]
MWKFGCLAVVLALTGILVSQKGYTALAGHETPVCEDPELQEAYRLLRSRNRVSRGFAKNQSEYLDEIKKISKGAHKERRFREAIHYFCLALLPFGPIYLPAHAAKIGTGTAIQGLGRVIEDHVLRGDSPVLDYDIESDPLGPAAMFSSADVKKRVSERLQYFEVQHNELREKFATLSKKYPDTLFARIRNRYSLGAVDDDYLKLVLAEGELREVLYSSEAAYTRHAMSAIHALCASRTEVKPFTAQELAVLIPLL